MLDVKSKKILMTYCFVLISLLEFSPIANGIKDFILPFFFKDTSIYTQFYSDDKYKNIVVGMSKKSVLEILGEPLCIDTWGRIERYHYSGSRNDSHYHIRQIHFFYNKVISKVHYYYID